MFLFIAAYHKTSDSVGVYLIYAWAKTIFEYFLKIELKFNLAPIFNVVILLPLCQRNTDGETDIFTAEFSIKRSKIII